jgi:hypothetical protein
MLAIDFVQCITDVESKGVLMKTQELMGNIHTAIEAAQASGDGNPIKTGLYAIGNVSLVAGFAAATAVDNRLTALETARATGIPAAPRARTHFVRAATLLAAGGVLQAEAEMRDSGKLLAASALTIGASTLEIVRGIAKV